MLRVKTLKLASFLIMTEDTYKLKKKSAFKTGRKKPM